MNLNLSLQLSPAMQRLLLRARFALTRAGWPAFAGICLALGALAFDALANDASEQELRKLVKEKRSLHQRWLKQKADEQTPTLDVDDLPGKADLDHRIGELHRLAQTHHVRLDQGEYRIERGNDSHLERCRITFPAHASYPDLRNWLDAITANDDGIIVDTLILKRPDIATERLETRIQLTLLERVE